MKLYTIGFTQKSAERFFGLLAEHGVEQVVDIRAPIVWSTYYESPAHSCRMMAVSSKNRRNSAGGR